MPDSEQLKFPELDKLIIPLNLKGSFSSKTTVEHIMFLIAYNKNDVYKEKYNSIPGHTH